MSAIVIQGDCREVLPTLPASSFDAIVTDPPYELTAARPGGRSEATRGAVMRGFMGMAWDATGAAQDPETWRKALRVAKPGAWLLAFGGTRTFHRMACAIEDAGWELRDCLSWIYGSGFPKSHNGPWGGSALKPAWEPIIAARKPLIGTLEENHRAHGVGGLRIDACRIGTEKRTYDITMVPGGFETTGGGRNVKSGEKTVIGRWPANVVHDGSDEVLAQFPDAPGQLADASSSSSRKTQFVYGAMKRGNGRDGEASADSENAGVVGFKMRPGARRGDDGSAARFFYCAKASREDRDEGLDGFDKRPLLWSAGTQNPGSLQSPNTEREARNFHPTVKPTALMRWLVRLVTPPGGRVLDMFAGSGSTGKACELEGFDCTLIEGEADYIQIIEARIAFARERRRNATAQERLFA